MPISTHRPRRYRPAGQKRTPAAALEYGPRDTGCPAVEEAIGALYEGQNETSFWALMHALNYAMQLETRVLVPVDSAEGPRSARAPWGEHPVPPQKAEDIPLWTVRAVKDQHWLPIFTSAAEAAGSEATADRPMAEKTLEEAFEYAFNTPGIDGAVLNPWGRSATLERALLNGLLNAESAHEPGEANLNAGLAAAAENDWQAAAGYYEDAAAEGSAPAQTLLGECYYSGHGRPKSAAKARALWRAAAKAGDVNALLDLGDDCTDAGAALIHYRRAQRIAREQPDIEYTPRVRLRIVQAETSRLASKRTLARRWCAEAARGFMLLARDGRAGAREWYAEAEALGEELAEGGAGLAAYKKSLHLD